MALHSPRLPRTAAQVRSDRLVASMPQISARKPPKRLVGGLRHRIPILFGHLDVRTDRLANLLQGSLLCLIPGGELRDVGHPRYVGVYILVPADLDREAVFQDRRRHIIAPLV